MTVRAGAAQKAQDTAAETDRIGRNLRRVRKDAGLTLESVSQMTGVAISTLSKIENSLVSLSYETLVRICNGLGLSIEEFVNPQHSSFASGRRTITKLGGTVIFSTDAYEYRVHATDLSRKTMIPLEMHIRARSPDDFAAFSRHEGEEFIYVLEGAIQVLTDIYSPVRLEEGESAYFDSGMSHAYLSVSREDARVLSVSYDAHGKRRHWEEFMRPALDNVGGERAEAEPGSALAGKRASRTARVRRRT